MKTSVCGESSGLGLSGLLSVLYTDGGEQTRVDGCDVKVAVIGGLGSHLEVLVVADPKDLAKPRSKFDLTQDSVRLLVIPPENFDEWWGEGDHLPEYLFDPQTKHGNNERTELDERAELLTTRVADYRRSVNSLATSIWHDLVAPKNPLDALDQTVADRIFEDLVPRTMAPAQAVENAPRPFIKELRSVTKEDYDLLWKEHFNPRETDTKMRQVEYDDLTALHKIVMLAVVPEPTPCSKTSSCASVICRKAVEWSVVAAAAIALQQSLQALGYLADVKSIWNSAANGSVMADCAAMAPMADKLQQELTSKDPSVLLKIFGNHRDVFKDLVGSAVEAARNSTPHLPVGEYVNDDLYDRYGVFVDPQTKTDLQSFRTPRATCAAITANSYSWDVQVGDKLMFTDSNICGWENDGILICSNLQIRNPQCFQYVSGDANHPRGLFFLWDMIDRIFGPEKGNKECSIHCINPDSWRQELLRERNKYSAGRMNPADEMRLFRTNPAWHKVEKSLEAVKFTNAATSTQTVNSTQTVDSTQTVKYTETPYSTQTLNSTEAPNSTQAVDVYADR
ncbi:hypothetical protein GNI_120150 [Gregarina niphandrodes]|uniref:Uncharacterized protein n=1 Tax=Gregarina niphandrodes TaxID=110365 RepID=A0A023B2H7_GRENI|nr:hypothetical protein GNI_120150 [Gregarina niphandrodes]EZG54772.1 hypothetical protein GNI_120150 [Gregarina niphandrodes]|eukprot:XP_011131832.1 hypothetical protein GNI_120150 [Gregarina niphandrodes]